MLRCSVVAVPWAYKPPAATLNTARSCLQAARANGWLRLSLSDANFGNNRKVGTETRGALRTPGGPKKG